MISEVEIVNIALGRLGESPIQSFEEGSVPANMAKVFYTPARRAVLRAYNWNFSLKTVRLAKLAVEPVDFRFAFSLPSDCLRVVRVYRKDETDTCGIRYAVRAGGFLYTSFDEVYCEYVADVEDVSAFDDKFIEALSYKLASDLAMPVKGSSELMGGYMNVFNSLIPEAATLTSGESLTTPCDNPYLEARYGTCQ